MNVLGIDPGLGNTGYGIISIQNNNFSVVDFGVIKTSTKDKLSERLKIIFNGTNHLIKKYKPSIFSIEEIFYSKNVKSSLLLGHARGVAIAAASTNELLVYEYSARKIKQSLTGNGNAHKDQVRFMVKNMLKMSAEPTSSDASDALGIALCYALQTKLEY